MTPEIDEVDAQISALKVRRDVLVQAHLATKAAAQLGEMIAWGRQARKGRVLRYDDWFGDVSYVVRTVLKSGLESGVQTVRPYDKPVRIADQPTQKQERQHDHS